MRLLITGAGGLVGQKILDTALNPASPFHGRFEVLATGRRPFSRPGCRFEQMDITDPAGIRKVFESFRPDTVIHSAAMTQVDPCELDPETCIKTNVEGTRNIVRACELAGSRLLHLSTDFIFDGMKPPYREEDPPDPLSVYGRSKLDAEKLVRESVTPWSIARTILVYGYAAGLSRSNIVLWVKQSLEAGKTIRVVADQFRAPTLAEDLAWGCLQILAKKAEGIYHLSGPDMMSILEIAVQTARFFKLDESKILPVATAELKEPGRRPYKTSFALEKAARDLDYRPRHLDEGLAFVKSQLEAAGKS